MARKQPTSIDAQIAELAKGCRSLTVDGTVLTELPPEIAATQAKPSKYRNTKTEIDGYVFDSKKEARRYLDLREEQRAGTITELQRQPEWPITMNGEEVCRYVPDFTYRRDGVLVVEDVKSAMTRKLPVYRLKVKLMKACHGVDVLET